MRILMTGAGGQLGSRVAALVDADPATEALLAVDVEAPKRRLKRGRFRQVQPDDRAKLTSLVAEFRPTAVIHLGIFEPGARATPREATARTAALAVGLSCALLEAGTLEHLVVRSGIEVYGRRRNSVVCPDESVPVDPTTPFGHSLRHVEVVADDLARQSGARSVKLRLAPLAGGQFPSPLARLLAMPLVPVAALGQGSFCVLHVDDAARAFHSALQGDHSGPLNVVAPGTVTGSQAVRIGGAVAVPTFALGWRFARLAAEVAGAPIPEHVRELLIRGRTADGTTAHGLLGVPEHTTAEVLAA